jgi:leucyl-tRNA synthetase
MKFDPKKFEKKWQENWEETQIYKTEDDSEKPTSFVADMFPYPSGSSMHVGHPRGYVATDVYSRFKRMNGFNVLHPMGWDAFGLPAEETAIENKEYPSVTVERNIKTFKKQLQMLGLSYDWSREINTTDPEYYKQTQRLFLEFFKRGLATNQTVPVNWCPELGTVLANEDIVNGKSERGGFPVFQMPMRQWVLLITKYADRLVDDLDLLPAWPDKVKNAQRAWIGKSEGYEFAFETSAGVSVPVFTTKLETLSGATFIVLAPENELVAKLLEHASNLSEVNDYIEQAKQKTDLDRQVDTTKTGVVIGGVTATNKLTGAQIPIVVADYVLSSYGTGAVMAVPDQDERDKEMAEVLNLPVTSVDEKDLADAAQTNTKFASLVNAETKKRYKIRDWVFSRQRFWGEPFPIVWVKGIENYEKISQSSNIKQWLPQEAVTYTNEAGDEFFAVPVIPEFLDSMQLPKVKSYEPTGTLEGPLAGIPEWVNASLNIETGEVKNQNEVSPPDSENWIAVNRETNTMPQWAGSSWYWLRYMDPHNSAEPFSKESAKFWGPVDVYSGADHAVAHLIYARFWHKVMQDAGMVDFPEPFLRLEFLGYILATDGTKISKRKGNSRSPEDVVEEVGADAFRVYEMFIGPFEKPAPWNDNDLIGSRRFLERVWNLVETVVKANAKGEIATDEPAEIALHTAIEKVTSDIESFKFNTAIASLMICLNELSNSNVSLEDLKKFIQLVAPFAPHMAEELWKLTDESAQSIHLSQWPAVNSEILKSNKIELPIQVNGKHRGDITVSKDISEAELKPLVLAHENIQKYLEGKEPKKFIYVQGRIVNLVI